MKFYFSFFLIIVLNYSFAQELKWGKISQAEMDISEVPFEPTANAVKLGEIGNLRITDFGYQLQEYGRTKILAASGMEHAEKKWSYNPAKKNDKVVLKSAQTINIVDGKTVITPVAKKDIIISQQNGIEEIAVAFPNVRVGSIIEYKVGIFRPNDLYASPWRFQNAIPTLFSKLDLALSTNYDYRIFLNGPKLTKKYGGKTKNRAWMLENIPSDKTFTHIYNREDFREKMMFQFTSEEYFYGTFFSNKNWADFRTLIRGEIRKSGEYADFVSIANQIPNATTKLETLRNCISYIKDHYQWNRYTAIKTGLLKDDFLRKKSGNMADFNILLNEILRIKNIRSELVINNMRTIGQIITAFPFYGRLQTLVNIVEIDNGEKLMIDVVSSNPENLRYLSRDFYNNIVVGLQPTEEVFLQVAPPLSEYISVQTLNINEKNSKLKIQNKSRGYFDDQFKKEQFYLFTGDKLKERESKHEGEWSFSTVELTIDNPNGDFFSIENPLQKIIADLKVNDNRDYPVLLDFPLLATIQLKTKIPDGYTFASDTFNTRIIGFDGNLQYIQGVEKVGDETVLTWSFLLNKINFSTHEINDYNSFLLKVNTAIAKAAVIKKKN